MGEEKHLAATSWYIISDMLWNLSCVSLFSCHWLIFSFFHLISSPTLQQLFPSHLSSPPPVFLPLQFNFREEANVEEDPQYPHTKTVLNSPPETWWNYPAVRGFAGLRSPRIEAGSVLHMHLGPWLALRVLAASSSQSPPCPWQQIAEAA